VARLYGYYDNQAGRGDKREGGGPALAHIPNTSLTSSHIKNLFIQQPKTGAAHSWIESDAGNISLSLSLSLFFGGVGGDFLGHYGIPSGGN
jgi:hypothetical protein